MSRTPFLTKLTLRNFRSIRHETVEFTNPLVLVGKNGSGKSNFVDALAFLSECINTPLSSIIKKRGNLIGLCSQTGFGHHAPFMALRVDFHLDVEGVQTGYYAFQLDTSSYNDFHVVREQCVVRNDASIFFDRFGDKVFVSVPGVLPTINIHWLALPVMGAVAEFGSLATALAAMRVYAIEPTRMRGRHYLDSGLVLEPNGSNTASVLQQIKTADSYSLERVQELVGAVTPGIIGIDPLTDANDIILATLQEGPNGLPLGFADINISDGTLRMTGLVAAAMQQTIPTVMTIEEPEANIHPGALDSVADIIETASQRSQVIITTHSPDLLDTKWLQPENIRVVEWEKGTTYISQLGDAPIKALQQHLMGAGELLRANALDAAPRHPEDAAELFDETPA